MKLHLNEEKVNEDLIEPKKVNENLKKVDENLIRQKKVKENLIRHKICLKFKVHLINQKKKALATQ